MQGTGMKQLSTALVVLMLSIGCGENSGNSTSPVTMDMGKNNAADSGTPTMAETDAETTQTDATAPAPDMMPIETPEPAEMATLDRAFAWLIGRFDSRDQALQNASYFSIQLISCEVNAPEIGEKVLYIEQASMDSPNQPYRQRLYHVTEAENGEIISTIYSLNNPGAAVGLCDRENQETFTPGEVALRDGCAVYLNWNGEYFDGSTRGEACSSTLGGASYATSEVILKADLLESWDRGFDATGRQVWGATEGAYIFVRRPEVEEMPEPTPGPAGVGETCETAPALADMSEPMADAEGPYTYRINGEFGATNDYNPLEASGLAPGCSVVYDAVGNDVVYRVDVEPGDQLFFRLTMPEGSAGGLYFLDSCEDGTWPDNDLSGACGRAEYRSHGNCSFQDCEPLEWTFEWPMSVNGQATSATSLFLVVDEVATNNAEAFVLEWSKTSLDN